MRKYDVVKSTTTPMRFNSNIPLLWYMVKHFICIRQFQQSGGVLPATQYTVHHKCFSSLSEDISSFI
jgi:hypothetical protein